LRQWFYILRREALHALRFINRALLAIRRLRLRFFPVPIPGSASSLRRGKNLAAPAGRHRNACGIDVYQPPAGEGIYAGRLLSLMERAMKTNVGTIDKVLRIVVGLALLSLFFVLEGQARWWGLVGLVPLLTGVFGVCPLYSLLGISTCTMDSKPAGR
jgi:hypothetical protein